MSVSDAIVFLGMIILPFGVLTLSLLLRIAQAVEQQNEMPDAREDEDPADWWKHGGHADAE